jgi:hypothetical protein
VTRSRPRPRSSPATGCEISDLARELRAAHPGQSDLEIHDRMLAHGSPPVRLLRPLIS